MKASGRRCRDSGYVTVAKALLALWTTANQFRAGHSFSSGITCPLQTIGCIADADCSVCIESLQATLAATDISAATCEDLYADVCVIVVEAGCDPTNPELIDLASCFAEDVFGCSEFTSCAEAVSATTPTPTTAAPNTVEPSFATTIAPSAATTVRPSAVPTAVPTTPDTAAPSPLVETTAAPTPSGSDGSRGGGLATASPSSADGSRDLDPGTPAPSSSTPVEPGEEAATDGGSGGWRSITAVTILTRVSIVTAIFLAI